MQYTKIVNTVRSFCQTNGAKPGFEINFLQKSSNSQCAKVLDLYEQASEVMEEYTKGSELDCKLTEIFNQLQSVIA